AAPDRFRGKHEDPLLGRRRLVVRTEGRGEGGERPRSSAPFGGGLAAPQERRVDLFVETVEECPVRGLVRGRRRARRGGDAEGAAEPIHEPPRELAAHRARAPVPPPRAERDDRDDRLRDRHRKRMRAKLRLPTCTVGGSPATGTAVSIPALWPFTFTPPCCTTRR